MSIPGSSNASGDGGSDAAGMPLPSTGSARPPAGAGGMPIPSMGKPSAVPDMPRPRAANVASPNRSGRNGAMPVPGQPPVPGTEALPRFGPPGGIAAGSANYEPGVVEVQFRAGVTPTLTRNGS